MYAGTTFRDNSGNIVGVHQRIDKVARHSLKGHLKNGFPTTKHILHFEGQNGPDGIKSKSPSKDEPWHFIDPHNPKDRALVQMITDHSVNLTHALKHHDDERAAFEAAWLAHTIVDGLTPAHHYPLADKIEELWGKPHHERTTRRDKVMAHGKTRAATVRNNWQYWGTGGIFAAHLLFEWGVAATIATMPLKKELHTAEKERVLKLGIESIFLEALYDIDSLHLYEEFGRKGWNHHLASHTRKILVPRIIQTVALAWYAAAVAAEEAEK